MGDVTFGRSGPYGDAWKGEPLTTNGGAIPGRSLMSMNAMMVFDVDRNVSRICG